MGAETAIILQEQNILSVCIKNPHYIYEVNEDYLISKTAKSIYRAIKSLYESSITVNTRNVYTETNKETDIQEELVQRLFELDVSKGDFNGLYSSLKKQWAKVDIQNNLLQDVLSTVSSKEEFDTNKMWEFKSHLEERLREVDDSSKKVYNLNDMFKIYDVELKDRQSGLSFYDTGCSHLNKSLLEGFAPQKITTLFGQSGVGKSTYALYLNNKQINKQIPSMRFSLEMPLISEMDRLVAQRLHIPLSALYYDEENEMGINDEILQMVEKEKKKMQNLPYFRYVEEEGLWIKDVEEIIDRTKKEMGVSYMVVTIDLLTMLKDFNVGNDSKATLYENAMNNLHEMVRRQNIHLLGVVQSRRPSGKVIINNVDDVEKLRPGIEEIKNSGGMEERSRIVLSVFRKKYFAEKYLPEDPEVELLDDILDCQILKNSQGSLGMLHYLFEGESAYLYKYENPQNNPSV